MNGQNSMRLGLAIPAVLTAGIITGGDIARAADIPVKAPAQVATVYSWTGFYVGGHAGYGWSDASATLEGLLNGVASPADAFFIGTPPIPNSYATRPRGFVGGGQLGFNYQAGKWVAGIEADYSYAKVNGEDSYSNSFTFAFLGINRNVLFAQSQSLDRLATIRARLGFTPVDTLLIYVTGGAAFARVHFSTSSTFLPISAIASFSGTGSANLTGWTAGAGAEYALSRNWSVKLEYLYVDLPDTSVLGIPTPSFPGVFTRANFDNDLHQVRAGLNYKFDWAVSR